MESFSSFQLRWAVDTKYSPLAFQPFLIFRNTETNLAISYKMRIILSIFALKYDAQFAEKLIRLPNSCSFSLLHRWQRLKKKLLKYLCFFFGHK